MLFELTWPAERAPITVSPMLRFQNSFATSAYRPMTATAAMAETGRSDENSTRASACASTVNSRNGERTKNVNRPST